MIIALLVILFGFGLIAYGIWNFIKFLTQSNRVEHPAPAQYNPFIEAHKMDEHNKRNYEDYLKWAHENNKTVIFDYESYQDKVDKSQDKKINRLFR